MRFVCISDTHGKHAQLKLPEGDVLLHAGDISMNGEDEATRSFLDWFSVQKFTTKIFIAGNHDFFFERESEDAITSIIPDNVIYLKDSGITINGINIWGSPVTPWFYDWAFNRKRGDEISRHWALIPQNTDILITHGPAFRRVDKNSEGNHVGCKDLFNKIHEVNLKVHVCGHIHEAYGQQINSGIKFINASVLDSRYHLRNSPVDFSL